MTTRLGELLSLLVKHCCDPSMAIRKQMISTLTELVVEHPTDTSLVAAWAKGTFPLVKDIETKVIR